MVLAAYPLLLMLVNDSWVFGDPLSGKIDDHIYTGYFFNLRQYLNAFPSAYFDNAASMDLGRFRSPCACCARTGQLYLARRAIVHGRVLAVFHHPPALRRAHRHATDGHA
jgi:hypothetical protein